MNLDFKNYPNILAYQKSLNLQSKGRSDAGVKRVQEISALLLAFKNIIQNNDVKTGLLKDIDAKKVESKENVEYLIVDKYYQNLSFFKKYIESEDGSFTTNVNVYKIISGLELAICEVQPLFHSDFKIRKELNAHFAFFVGLGFLTGWEKEDFFQYSFPNLDKDKGEEEELSKLLKEHIDWLYMLQSQFHLPYFPNAHTWWALKMLLHEFNEKR